jgi:polyisoprenoid-binding protein YceI
MSENLSSLPRATGAVPGYVAGTFKADPVHSEIAFSVRQLGVSKVRGRFTSYGVMIITGEDPLSSSVTATIDLASVDTGNKRRDNHLRSVDYFEVDKYATMTYRSTNIRQTDGGWVIDGELTLRAVTQQVPLAVVVKGFGPDPRRGTRVGFAATAQINRRDFGIDIAMSRGGAVISDKVSISLDIEAVSQT